MYHIVGSRDNVRARGSAPIPTAPPSASRRCRVPRRRAHPHRTPIRIAAVSGPAAARPSPPHPHPHRGDVGSRGSVPIPIDTRHPSASRRRAHPRAHRTPIRIAASGPAAACPSLPRAHPHRGVPPAVQAGMHPCPLDNQVYLYRLELNRLRAHSHQSALQCHHGNLQSKISNLKWYQVIFT